MRYFINEVTVTRYLTIENLFLYKLALQGQRVLHNALDNGIHFSRRYFSRFLASFFFQASFASIIPTQFRNVREGASTLKTFHFRTLTLKSSEVENRLNFTVLIHSVTSFPPPFFFFVSFS